MKIKISSKMSACFYPIKNSDNYQKNFVMKFRFIEHINLIYNIEKTKIYEFIRHLFSKDCDSNILFGFEKSKERFWYKKYDNKKTCELYIEIDIIKINFHSSKIKIIPLVGIDKDIKNIIFSIDRFLQLHQKYDAEINCIL